MGRITLTVHADDNVTTILDTDIDQRKTQTGLPLLGNIKFGHKVALRAIQSGESIIKYGIPIGIATQDIQPGEHVHTHNCK
ncbi:MAG: D-galactarate dehydratase [Burkholderiaceae bacterium]|jgi:hypothetical protein|nr:D-galactarate dehydratase [Burkholderiaceae bacterium]